MAEADALAPKKVLVFIGAPALSYFQLQCHRARWLMTYRFCEYGFLGVITNESRRLPDQMGTSPSFLSLHIVTDFERQQCETYLSPR